MSATRVIRQLSPAVVNKIAAGEVIERPASVVKELVENAIDAGATRIDVTLEKGGTDLIRVTDNGCGIPAEQLPLALASHATSKIESADDLFSVTTLGFRGEALASIASISRLVVRTRVAAADAGAELEAVGGKLGEVQPLGCPVGTTMEVRNLFFNTPVRHKFLRTTQTELGHGTEVVTRMALALPQVHFSLRHQGRVIHELAPVTDLRHRVASFFGRELAENLIAIDSESEGVRLSGYVANPTDSRSHPRMQYLFLNGRVIRDRSLQHALAEAYRGLLLTGRYPICFLRLDMPVEMVDVNVHPAKLEVRFQDAGRLYSHLLGTLRTKFLTSDLRARVRAPGPAEESTGGDASDELVPAGASQLVEWARRELEQKQFPAARFDPGEPRSLATATGPLSLHRLPPSRGDEEREFAASRLTAAAASPVPTVSFSHPDPPAPAPAADAAAVAAPARRQVAIQLHNRYLVAESQSGLEVIDQHALHERILYEQIRDRLLSGSLESQRLLVPEPVDLAPSEAAAVLSHVETLAKLGIAVEPFGGETVLVTSYPAILRSTHPGELLRRLVEKLVEGNRRPEARDILDDMLHSVACQAAVKYGDPLSPEEIEALLEARHAVADQHHCPHGRPTTIVFTRAELDRHFRRI